MPEHEPLPITRRQILKAGAALAAIPLVGRIAPADLAYATGSYAPAQTPAHNPVEEDAPTCPSTSRCPSLAARS